MEITTDFIEECQNKFYEDEKNIVARNAIHNVGVHLTALDPTQKPNHVFLYTTKPKNLKATNQGNSGRCWMYAGLNMLRKIPIQALGIKDFEFSQTYLFFWDKLERSNAFIQWFIDHDYSYDSRYVSFMRNDFISDGGFWSTFKNLVNKYGLVPKSEMPETAQSGYSSDMNERWEEILFTTVINISKQKDGKQKMKWDALKRVYDLLVKFLGQPPQSFNWYYETEDCEDEKERGIVVKDLSPLSFRRISTGGLKINDFIVLTSTPNMPYRKKIEIKYTNMMSGKGNVWALNLEKRHLSKYAKKSILGGIDVWFAGDVSNGFDYYNSALNESAFDYKSVFGKNLEVSEKDKIRFRMVQGNHAMLLCGVNLDEDENPTSWQVENSWGYWDEETLGEDGFLTMSDKWFQDNLVQIVVHKEILSRIHKKVLNSAETIVIEPWCGDAPAIFVKGKKAPKGYGEKLSGSKRKRANISN